MRRSIIISLFLMLAAGAAFSQGVTQGQLEAVGKASGTVPLKHTSVDARITGFLSRVTVTQEFENNFTDKIEAIYVFPLPDSAAVDSLVMRIGERTVRGKIMKREEAREVYEAAKSNGQIASLLDQERPNIFTQSVANILPGEKIIIEISYVETLKYEAGSYEFVFPMVVGPRYVPGNATGSNGMGFSPDTDQVPDGSRITPTVAKERAGHDISLSVTLDAGVPVQDVVSNSHQVESSMLSASSYRVELADRKTIPNKDFVLKYQVAGSKIDDAVLTHRGQNGGYFSLILQPPDKVNSEDVTPKEIVFVLDTSGSMSGFPMEKAKEAMKMALEGLNPYDTFNLITFAGDTHILFKEPVTATRENLAKAQEFLRTREGGGGTEMMKAIKAALDPSDSQEHIRIVCFMTDGYIGNDMAILGEIKQHPNARIFSFGIGGSVNRYLLENMAEEGRGEAEFVSLKDDGSAAAKRFHERVRSPLLTDISIDFSGLAVADVYPKRINDLFSAKPVVIHGRYTKGGKGTIRLIGKSFGREVIRRIPVTFPEKEEENDVLATLWARTRIADLMSQDYNGVQNRNAKPEVESAITNLGIEYRLMTQYTSFVAVEERVVTDGGKPITIEVPVELPEGVSREGIFGSDDSVAYGMPSSQIAFASKAKSVGYAVRKVEVRERDDRDQKVDKETAEEYSVRQSLTPFTLPAPVVPKASGRSDETVNVSVELNSSGKVVSAKVTGAESARSRAAVAAATLATFKVPETELEIEKIRGVLSYVFTKDGKVKNPAGLAEVDVLMKPNKYHTDIRALVKRLKAGDPAAASEASFVTGGRAFLAIRLSILDNETIGALKARGFTVLTEMRSAKAVVGSIDVGKIASLTEIEGVTFISPQRR